MRPLRALRAALAVLCVGLAGVALALTPTQDVLLFGKIKPVWTANFLTGAGDYTSYSTLSSLPSGGSATRTGGNDMMFDASGYLTYGPNNLLGQSNTFSDVYWSKDGVTLTNANSVSDPFGGTQASTITASSGNMRLLRNVGSVPGQQQVNSIWVRRRTGTGTVIFWTPAEAQVDVTSLVSSSWAQIFLKGDATTTNYFILSLGTASDALDIYGAVVGAVTYETFSSSYTTSNYTSAPRQGDQVITTSAPYYGPRYDYSYNGSAWVQKGLLLEGAATNYAPTSGDLNSASWTKTSADTTGTKITAPDGTTSFVPVNDTLATAGHSVQMASATVGAGATVTGSIYLKQNTARYAIVYVSNAVDSSYSLLVDLQAGTILGNFTGIPNYSAPTSSAIQSIGGGVYRVSLTLTLSGARSLAALAVATNISGSTSSGWVYSGTGTGFYAWGGQIELGSFATSYIPNTGSGTTTRTADTFALSGYNSNLVVANGTSVATGATLHTTYATGASAAPQNQWLTSLNIYNGLAAGSQALPSGLTYTGASLATMFDSTGTLTYKPNNLYINSNSATNTARTISTTAGINYYIWIQTTSGSATVVASGTNTTTFNGSSGGTFTAFTATTGTLTLTPTSNYANITQVVVAAITYESALRSGDNVVTSASAYYGPRFDTNPATLAPAGLLVEGAATNLALQSNNFGTTWIGSVTTITPNAATSPDGTSNATKLTWQNGQATAYIYQTALPASAGTWTYSVYAKSAGFAGLRLDVYNPTDGESYTNFDLSNGTITSGSGVITAIGNGWYRCSKTYTTTTGTSTQVQIRNVQTGDGTNGVYIYGVQFEAGSSPTSYIPTTSASVTRTADAVTPTTYAAKATIWQRKSESAGTTARAYYAPGALPSPFDTGYWYQSMAAYPRALTTAEQTPRLVVGAPY